jgi:plasmid stability protein
MIHGKTCNQKSVGSRLRISRRRALPPLQSTIKLPSMKKGSRMASMTIRNLDDGLKKRLRIRAAAHGRSMEDEARDILRAALSTGENRPANLAAAIRSRIVPLGGVELELPLREAIRDLPDFSG